jgi:hypothetical protein
MTKMDLIMRKVPQRMKRRKRKMMIKNYRIASKH